MNNNNQMFDNLTNEEIQEIIKEYSRQVVKMEEMKIKIDMYEEWAVAYKKENEELRKLIKQYDDKLVEVMKQLEEQQDDDEN